MSSVRAPNGRASPADREMRDLADITLDDAPDDGASPPPRVHPRSVVIITRSVTASATTAPDAPLSSPPPAAPSDDESAFAAVPPVRRLRSSEPLAQRENSARFDWIVERAKQSPNTSRWVVHPASGFRLAWDVAQIIILLYVALAIPYRFSFDVYAYGGWYLLEFLIDVYFWIDLILGFFMAYWEPTPDDDYRYVVDLNKIQSEYLRTWFTVDMLACIPVNLISRTVQGTATCSWSWRADPCAGRGVALSHSQRTAIHLFAALRLLKLLRIFGAVRVLKRYEELSLQYHKIFSMCKLLMVLSLLSHWMACTYGSVYNFAREDHAGREMRPWELYVAALYWAVQTLTTVGYGNVVPQTVLERLIACGVMVLGGFMFSWIISKVSTTLSEDSAERLATEKRLAVRRFVKQKRIPKPTARRIKSHYTNLRARRKPGNCEVIADLPRSIRNEVMYFVYGETVVRALNGDVLPNEAIVEHVCQVMLPRVLTRDTPPSMADAIVDRVFIITEGQLCVARRESDLLVDDGEPETREYHREFTETAKTGQPRLCGPGLLVNPGLTFGFRRGTLCVVPYDKTVEAVSWSPEDFDALFREFHGDAARNVVDTFIEQLRHSRRALQLAGLRALGREDLWDAKFNRVNTGWRAQLRAERKREDAARRGEGKDDDDAEDPRLEASPLVDASKDEKIEALQKQVQRMHKDLAEVGNKFKDAEERGRKATQAHGAEIKKLETSMIRVMEEHTDRVERMEDAIEGLHRMLQTALEDKWTSEGKHARGGSGAAAGGSRKNADAEGSRGGIVPVGRSRA